VLPGNEHVYAQYTLRCHDRDAVARALAERGVPTQIHYPRCLHQQPVFAGLGRDARLQESERAARDVLSLPLYVGLTDADQGRVIDAIVAHAKGRS
jgi:UDP-2-acetamido-2-deoxy-ribo-hexuluronate aminotransferase